VLSLILVTGSLDAQPILCQDHAASSGRGRYGIILKSGRSAIPVHLRTDHSYSSQHSGTMIGLEADSESTLNQGQARDHENQAANDCQPTT
jgi:hypothetical protein